MKNLQWVVASTPQGKVGLEHFKLVEGEAPVHAPNTVLLRNLMVAVEPANAVWMKTKSYIPQLMPGDLVPGFGIGEVIASDAGAFSVGDIVEGHVGWQNYALVQPKILRKRNKNVPLDQLMGLVGISGITSYYGMIEIGRVRAGESVLVSAAGGAVGNIAVQIAKIAGCKVFGIAGGPDKCAWLKDEYALDGVLDYKTGDLAAALKAACPGGFDYFFDNAGGDILEAGVDAMKIGGRIGLCGVVAQLDGPPDQGVRGVPLNLILKRIGMQGFLLSDYSHSQRQAAEDVMLGWAREGKLKAPMHLLHGIEQTPQALLDLLAGQNRGKAAVLL